MKSWHSWFKLDSIVRDLILFFDLSYGLCNGMEWKKKSRMKYFKLEHNILQLDEMINKFKDR